MSKKSLRHAQQENATEKRKIAVIVGSMFLLLSIACCLSMTQHIRIVSTIGQYEKRELEIVR